MKSITDVTIGMAWLSGSSPRRYVAVAAAVATTARNAVPSRPPTTDTPNSCSRPGVVTPRAVPSSQADVPT